MQELFILHELVRNRLVGQHIDEVTHDRPATVLFEYILCTVHHQVEVLLRICATKVKVKVNSYIEQCQVLWTAQTQYTFLVSRSVQGVHSNIISTSLGRIQPRCNYCMFSFDAHSLRMQYIVSTTDQDCRTEMVNESAQWHSFIIHKIIPICILLHY